ncbi:CP family cyanate transporter-like MFS transporter [Pseudoclavibacter sp. JAI123]|uniref:MFS transporter n=1 Tax=Pseudoclavibacter sp. JAI123 TaxID=2723065 RepID=UPI0015CB61F6|nr:MFS transporter [Pseudoclavibacter sp. JAI123]NYF14902.1 CP family cyanate transporter-like MFS transporter [Pseudoclavibacter sp. JAI123]
MRQRAARRQGVAAGILVVAVGLSVRFPITNTSALLGEIGAGYALPQTALAVLSTIPVILFALAAPLAPLLVAKLGLSRSLSLLLGVLAIATLLRPLGPSPLFVGTALIGASIAVLGILAPQLIRSALAARAGLWTGLYTASFGVSAATGAALSVPLFHVLDDDLGQALAAWGVPLLIALGIALGLGRRIGAPLPARRPGGAEASVSIWQARGLWPVTGFFACQALLYFALTAWLPTIAVDRGASAAQAGLLLAWMSVAGLPAALFAPMLASRARWRTPLLIATATLGMASLVGLAIAPLEALTLVVAVLGIALSSAFGISVALIVLTAPSSAATAAFSAVVQGVGYAVAALGPLVSGLFVGAGMSWPAVIAGLAGVALLELGFGIASARASLSIQRSQALEESEAHAVVGVGSPTQR